VVTSGTIPGWDADIGSVISWHATPTEYAKGRHARISAIQARYQQTIARHTFCYTRPAKPKSDLHKLVRTRAALNPVDAIRDRLASPAKNPWR
jgi:hypothetical protein